MHFSAKCKGLRQINKHTVFTLNILIGVNQIILEVAVGNLHTHLFAGDVMVSHNKNFQECLIAVVAFLDAIISCIKQNAGYRSVSILD